MAHSEMLSGHEPRAPFAMCGPPPRCCRLGATLQTCLHASSKGDLNVTLQLKRLIHPTSPVGSAGTVSFPSFSVINCYYFFRIYTTIKVRLQFPAAATPPTNQKNVTFILKRLNKYALNTEGHGFQTPRSLGSINCSFFDLIHPQRFNIHISRSLGGF